MTCEPGGKAALDVRGLSYTFAGREQPSLGEISFSLVSGSWTLLAGRTGSGKSTLLRALAGLIPNQAAGEMRGSVHLFGLDTRGARPASLARTAGLVLQSPDDQICTTTVESEVAFGLANLGLAATEIDARMAHWLEKLGLSACRQQATQTLSGGQKQRLMLASILAMGPRLLLLDEPLAQLDCRAVTELLEVLDGLRRIGLSLVMAEHRLDHLLTKVDRVLVLDGGRLAADCAAGDPELTSSLDAAGLVAERPPLAASGCARRATIETPAPVVRAARLAHRFPGQAHPLWENVNFDISAGERVCLLGENGCGKSTLLHALAGVVRPVAGEVILAAAPAGSLPVGLVPQNPDLTLFCRTVDEELAFGPRQLGLALADVAARVGHVARSLAIDDLLEEAPQALSQGQRLRVAVAAALTLRPRLLLLDEPTTGQDPVEVRRLLGEITAAVAAGEAGAVLFSTHDVRTAARLATRVLVLAGSRLVADRPAANLLADEELLAEARLGPARHETLESTVPSATMIAADASGPQNDLVSYVDSIDRSRTSWIAQCDPRLKLGWLAAVSLAAVLVDSMAALVGLFAATLVIALAIGWTRRTRLIVAGILLAVAWGTVLSQAMFYPAPSRTPLVTFVRPFTAGSVEFPGIALYREGAAYGLLQSLRMLAAILAGLSVCLSTSPERLLVAMVSLRIPAAVSFMTVTALRFLPTMIEQWMTVRWSCQFRGYRTGVAGGRRRRWPSLRTEAALCVPVMAAALRRAATLATSLTARGFEATRPRTTYPPLAMTRLECAVVVLLSAATVVLSGLKTFYWLTNGRLHSLPRLEALNELVGDWL